MAHIEYNFYPDEEENDYYHTVELRVERSAESSYQELMEDFFSFLSALGYRVEKIKEIFEENS